MKSFPLIQGLFLLLCWSRSCNGLAGWRSAATPIASVQRREPSLGSAWPLHARQRRRAVVAAVASASHLTTGRTASGLLENCLEGAINTMQSFIGGGIMGCIIGGVMGGSFGRVPDVGWLKSVQTKAVEMGGSWGQLSAAFSGFTSLSTIVRGRNDKWDQVLGACGAGAFLSRDKGPRAMAQGAATYGLFSLIFAFPGQEDELDVVDIPVDAPKKSE